MNELMTVTNTNTITVTNGNSLAGVIVDNPILADILTFSESSQTRYLHELRAFGEYIGHGNMQTVEQWEGVTAEALKRYQAHLLYEVGMRTTTANQILYIIRKFARIAYDAGAITIEELTRIEHIKGLTASKSENVDATREKAGKATSISERHNVKGYVTKLSKQHIFLLKFGHGEDLAGRRDALLFNLLLDFGLRISDAVAITVDTVDMVDRIVTVKTMKTSTELKLRMTQDIYEAFVSYFELYQPLPGASIWTGINKGGRPSGTFGKHSAQMRITAVAKAFNLPNLSAHDLRHAWTDRAIAGGSDLESVRQAGGWKSIQMVSHYASTKTISNEGVKLL